MRGGFIDGLLFLGNELELLFGRAIVFELFFVEDNGRLPLINGFEFSL